MKSIRFILPSLLLMAACAEPDLQMEISIDMNAEGRQVSDHLYGIFIEDINRAIDGRLYAEMVMNRSFEDAVVPKGYHTDGNTLISPLTYNHVTGQMVTVTNRWNTDPVPGWKLTGSGTDGISMHVAYENPYFETAPHYLRVTNDAQPSHLRLTNSGYGGYTLKQGETYHLRLIARSQSGNLPLRISLTDSIGETVSETEVMLAGAGKWNDLSAIIKAGNTITDGLLQVSMPDNWTGTLDLDYVSLMPDDTYHHRPNGLRRDVAETIEAMHPSFVRWPGGCVVEGITLETRFRWKESMGDPASRPGAYNLWGYRNTCGFGWKEALDFCEDLNAAAMYVCNVGMACQAQTSELAAESELSSYLQDCLDAIEYAIGDTSTEWGSRRASDGHPEPYRLEYVEIGNENWGAKYDERYTFFYNAIHDRYPQLTLISNYGLDHLGSDRTIDYLDPHWYVAPQFFFNNSTIFDDLPRTGTSIYVGEYACNRSVGSGNMEAALSEAAFMLGIERNSDLVTMCSYAPLLESDWYRAWPTNLIWVSPTQVMGRSSYHVQKLMAENRPTRSLPITPATTNPESISYERGRIGMGCWKSEVEFREAQISVNGAAEEPLSLEGGTPFVGEWKYEDGLLRQSAIVPRCKYLLPKIESDTYTLELQARKMAGKDAFIIYFGMDDEGQEGYYYSIGGQNNSKACVEKMQRGENSGQDGDITAFHAEMSQWYNLRIEVTPQESRLYVDGELLITHRPQTYSLQAFAAGYDDNTDELIVKAVNASDKPLTIGCKPEGIAPGMKIASHGTAITLCAKSLTDENSFEHPDLITPVTTAFKVRNQDITYTLEPYSFTILRLPVRK